MEVFHDPDDPGVQSVAKALADIAGKSPVPGKSIHFDKVSIKRAGGVPFDTTLLITALELEEEQIYLFLFRKPASKTSPATMKIIDAINRNRRRLAILEESLGRLDLGESEKSRSILENVKEIDRLLRQLDENLANGDLSEEKRLLGVTVLKLALDYWTATTGESKPDLADRSGIWRLYFERDGYARTQTLDRYLSLETLPRKPRWKKILATAEYVLADCDVSTPLREQLERDLWRLRSIL